MIKRVFKTAAAAAAALVAIPAFAAVPLFDDVVIVKGDNVEVRQSKFDESFIAYKANLAARGQTIPEEKRLETEARLLDRLIVSQIMLTKATPADKAKAQEKAQKFLDDTGKSAGSPESFARQLKSLGITPQQFTNRVVEQAVAEELLAREVRSKIVIAPEAIAQYYETNAPLFQQPEMARASHIVIYTIDPKTRQDLPDEQKKIKRMKAEKALDRAKAGEDFSKLVMELSEDPAVNETKGEYKFTRAKDDPRRAMVPEFEAAAFALKTNQISRLVPTAYGFHIIKLLELTPARKQPLTEVSDRIRDALTGAEVDKRLPEYFTALKKEANIKVLDKRMEDAIAELPPINNP